MRYPTLMKSGKAVVRATGATGAGSELNIDVQPGPMAMSSMVGVGVVNAHIGFVDGPTQAGRVGSGSAVNCGGEEEFYVSDFSD
jgi:hypothetical protein